jgi:hypothetical protein
VGITIVKIVPQEGFALSQGGGGHGKHHYGRKEKSKELFHERNLLIQLI